MAEVGSEADIGIMAEGARLKLSSINQILIYSVISIHLVASICYVVLVAILLPVVGKPVEAYLPGDESVCIFGLILVVGHFVMTSMALNGEIKKKPESLFLWLAYIDSSILLGVLVCLYAYFAHSVKITALLKFIIWLIFLVVSHVITKSRIQELHEIINSPRTCRPVPDNVSMDTCNSWIKTSSGVICD